MREIDEERIFPCAGGVFTLPERSYAMLEAAAQSGIVWLRQDEDTFIVSPLQIDGGRRRALARQIRAQMFLKATRLVVVDDSESVRVMAVEWRKARVARE